jgi:signal transduction histidine kinase
MRKDWLARLAAARYARAVSITLVAAAAVGQAFAQAVTLGKGAAPSGPTGFPAIFATEYVLPLSLLALLATVPLAVYRPVMAAVAVTFGNAVALASLGQVTAAGMAAEVVAVCWLGLAGGLDGVGVPRRFSVSGRNDSAAMAGRYLALGLGLPFLGIALARGGWAAVLLASAVPVAGGTGIAVWAGQLARTRTEAGEALADTLLAHTARGERARIARELHDVVAHHISMIAVLAETGRLATPGLPEAGARRFLEIGDTARAGLTEMRRLLGVLREDAADDGGPGGGGGRPATAQAADADAGVTAAGGDATTRRDAAAGGGTRASRQPQPGLAQLTELIDSAREASGAGTRLIMSGPVAPLDPGVELAAYRIVQEALTNARRHAPGAAVDVELRYSPGSLRVRVRDNGPGPGPDIAGLTAGGLTGGGSRTREPTAGGGHAARPLAGSVSVAMPTGSQPGKEKLAEGPQCGGHGLLGMRERAFSVGGALYVGAARGGGFLVEAVLPSEPYPQGERSSGPGGSRLPSPLAPILPDQDPVPAAPTGTATSVTTAGIAGGATGTGGGR